MIVYTDTRLQNRESFVFRLNIKYYCYKKYVNVYFYCSSVIDVFFMNLGIYIQLIENITIVY